MSKKLAENLYLKEGDQINEVATAKVIAAFAKEHEIKKAEAEETFKDILKDKSAEDYGFEGEELKKWKAVYKAASKVLEDSDKNKEKLNEQIAKEEEKKEKEVQLITASAEKGGALTANFEKAMLDGIQHLVGDQFVVSPAGLSVAKDATVTKAGLARAISSLAEGGEKGTRINGTLNIALGEACLMADDLFGQGEGEQLVLQAIEVRGQSKHTAMQAKGVVNRMRQLYDEPSERPGNLTYTHWQEVKNAGWNNKGEQMIPKAKLKSIIAQTSKGRDGKPLSCADMRELLNAERPDKQDDGNNGDGGEGESSSTSSKPKGLSGYLYMNSDNPDDIVHVTELDKDRLKEKNDAGDGQKWFVFDLSSKCTLKPSGKKDAEFQDGFPAEEGEEGDGMPE